MSAPSLGSDAGRLPQIVNRASANFAACWLCGSLLQIRTMSETPVVRLDVSLCRRPVRWLTARLAPPCPAWVQPEAIVIAGLALSLAAAIALHLAGVAPGWFWAATVLLLARTIADCLDGEIARRRSLVSDHGMFLDIFIDDLSFTAIFLGIATASYADFAVIAIAALIYLLNDVLLNLRIHFLRRHEIPAVSPVEVCVLMIVGCGLTYFFPQMLFTFFGCAFGWFDALAALGSAYGIYELLTSARRLYVELKRAGR